MLCVFSFPFSVASLRTRLHAPSSERAESADQCMALPPVVMATKRAPRTTSERSARRSCVSACPEYARARGRAQRTHTHVYTDANAHAYVGQPPATCRDETRERPRAEDDRCPVNFAMYCEHVAYDESIWLLNVLNLLIDTSCRQLRYIVSKKCLKKIFNLYRVSQNNHDNAYEVKESKTNRNRFANFAIIIVDIN